MAGLAGTSATRCVARDRCELIALYVVHAGSLANVVKEQAQRYFVN